MTKPNPENCKNCSSKCAYNCAQLQYTIQHRTVLIISPLTSRQTERQLGKVIPNKAIDTKYHHYCKTVCFVCNYSQSYIVVNCFTFLLARYFDAVSYRKFEFWHSLCVMCISSVQDSHKMVKLTAPVKSASLAESRGILFWDISTTLFAVTCLLVLCCVKVFSRIFLSIYVSLSSVSLVNSEMCKMLQKHLAVVLRCKLLITLDVDVC